MDPTLVGKPVIVGGSRERGVVASCSYETRPLGVRSGMPMQQALKLCPQAIVLHGNRSEYSRYSRWVTEIIAAQAPQFEKASIDEFYIDLTGMERFFDPVQWTQNLRRNIVEQTGLPISCAIAANKLVAKIATEFAKPNHYIVVPAGEENTFLAPLRVNKIPGVGEHLFRTLLDLGIETIGELAAVQPAWLEQHLGKYGRDLWQKANGIHDAPVQAYHENKSISSETTFDANIDDASFLEATLVRLTEKVAHELRRENKMAGCIAVKLRYPDFETRTHQRSIPYTCYDDELIVQAKALFRALYNPRQPLRLLGVKLTELVAGAAQTHLFQDATKKHQLYKAIDDLKEKFGPGALQKAGATRQRKKP